MAFIDTISESDCNEDVHAMYARQRAHYGYLPNYAKVFCYRPELMGLWAQLQAGIKRNLDKRTFELVTFVAAQTLRSTLCSLAHGSALTEFMHPRDVMALGRGETPDSLVPADARLVSFVRMVARDASSVTRADVDDLKAHGFTDATIFDVVAVASGRAFFTKLIEALGVEVDAPYYAMDPAFRVAMTVGRPVGKSPYDWSLLAHGEIVVGGEPATRGLGDVQ